MGCDETATVCGTCTERTGEISDIVQVSTNGNAAYMASLNDGTRWYREFTLDTTGDAVQYLAELIELRKAQHDKDPVTFRTTKPEELGTYSLEKYQVLSGYTNQVH